LAKRTGVPVDIPSQPNTSRAHYPKTARALAIAAATGSPPETAAKLLGIHVTTIRRWVSELEAMPDSELEALIIVKKRTMSGLWGILGVDALEFAQELRTAGEAKGFLSAMTAAGICSTKLEALGQPRQITPHHDAQYQSLIDGVSTPISTDSESTGQHTDAETPDHAR
jgi:hypothetical protein